MRESDTLEGVCLKYDVNPDIIRRYNGFTGDNIFMKRELIIPNSGNYSTLPILDGPIYQKET